jgi:surface polysaccharide O-acyltransferase-like enzyme
MGLDIEQRQSKVLNAIRFPLIVLVVFMHGTYTNNCLHSPISLEGKKIYDLISEMISTDLGSCAVPCFFIISGYFFFYKKEVFNIHFYKTQLRKRVKTLLIPYLIWNMIFIIIPVLINCFFVHYGKSFECYSLSLIKNNSFFDLFWSVYKYPPIFQPIDSPLWYVRDLMCMVVLSPVFYFFFHYTKIYGLIALTIIYLFGLNTNIPGLNVTSFLFFGIGAFCALKNINMVDLFSRYRSVANGLSIVLLIVIAYFRYTDSQLTDYFIRFFSMVGIVAMVNLVSSLIEKETLIAKLISLSSAVFFIYAIHDTYIIGFIGKIYSFKNSLLTWWELVIRVFLISVTCVLVCYYLYILTKKIMPRVLSILVGDRF